jgi:hypothetical protein
MLNYQRVHLSFPSGITQLDGLHGLERICAKALEISTKAGLLLLPRRNWRIHSYSATAMPGRCHKKMNGGIPPNLSILG